MTSRTWSTILYRCIDEDYLPATLEHIKEYTITAPPTTSAIAGWIDVALPGYRIDTRWETMREMLQGAALYGCFSVKLIKPDEDKHISYTLSFLEEP